MPSHPSVMDVITLANSIRQTLYRQQCLPEPTPVLAGLASGLDTALTLLEASIGSFAGLSPAAARDTVAYFQQEAKQSSASNPEIAIWYVAYAAAIERIFLQGRVGT